MCGRRNGGYSVGQGRPPAEEILRNFFASPQTTCSAAMTIRLGPAETTNAEPVKRQSPVPSSIVEIGRTHVASSLTAVCNSEAT
jgi:hypothetical protein